LAGICGIADTKVKAEMGGSVISPEFSHEIGHMYLTKLSGCFKMFNIVESVIEFMKLDTCRTRE
jgi:hypothetical protein